MIGFAYFLIGTAFGALLIEGIHLRSLRRTLDASHPRPTPRPEPRRPFLELD